MTSATDDIRSALADNFGIVTRALYSISFAHRATWNNEEDYLSNLYQAINTSGLARGIPVTTPKSNYFLLVECEKIHKTIWVDFLSNGLRQRCEIGDILLVAKYRDPQGIVSRCSCFIQVKVARKRLIDSWEINKTQLDFYSNWPMIQACYVQYFKKKDVFSTNLKISPRNRLFSPYLLLGRTWNSNLLCGPSPWITGADLVSAASIQKNRIQAPLEVPFFTHLLQMLFQATGENDYVNYHSQNRGVSNLVDSLLNYVHLNDPPEGEGKPFLVILLTVKAEQKHQEGSYRDKNAARRT